jgi:hypothetical protein
MILSEIIPEKLSPSYCGADATRSNDIAMMKPDDDSELLPISLDAATVARLARLSRACGAHPAALAASLLHDILLDDEAVNVLDRPCRLN